MVDHVARRVAYELDDGQNLLYASFQYRLHDLAVAIVSMKPLSTKTPLQWHLKCHVIAFGVRRLFVPSSFTVLAKQHNNERVFIHPHSRW